MNRRTLLITTACALVAAYGGRLAWRAHKDIVSLKANDLALRDVIKKLKWQTWESIEVNKDVDGRVNLTVEDQPLTVVLDLIAEQVGSRWSVAYPLYSTKPKLALAIKVANGTAASPQPGWTNWNARPNFAAMAARIMSATNSEGMPTNFPGMFGGGPGGMDGTTEAKPVTIEWSGTPPLEAAQALRQFGRVKVVPEDGTTLRVNLSLKEVPMDKAVAKLAKASNRKWAKFYALEPQRRQGPPSQEERPQFTQGNEQRRERFEQMAQDPAFQDRMDQRQTKALLNSTPAQRVDRDKRRQQGRGRGGPR